MVGALHGFGVTANQVTVVACAISVAIGLWLVLWQPFALAYVIVPFWMFIRMVFNAVDGMLAREFGQQSVLGAYLNELTDVVSDAALYLPFALIVPDALLPVILVIWLAALSEFAGSLGIQFGGSRRYDGPMGKSDRALVFGALGLWFALAGELPGWSVAIVWATALLALLTVVRRIVAGLREAGSDASSGKPEGDGSVP
jgi:CDP-diacylglycerol--glycerol-3-phosphate 3-phosphatidyltransferase